MGFESFRPTTEQPQEEPRVDSPETRARKAWQETVEEVEGEVEGKKIESTNETVINKISRWEKLKNMRRSAAEIAGGVGVSAWSTLVMSNGAWGMMSGSPDRMLKMGVAAGIMGATAVVGFSARRWMKRREQINAIKNKALKRLERMGK